MTGGQNSPTIQKQIHFFRRAALAFAIAPSSSVLLQVSDMFPSLLRCDDVPLADVHVDLGGLSVDLVDGLVLLLDEHRHLVHHLSELRQALLDLLDLGVTLLDLAVGATCGTVRVGVEEGLSEDLGVVVVDDIVNLRRRGVGLDNLELASGALLGLGAVLLLDGLVLLEKLLEVLVDSVDLGLELLVALGHAGKVLDGGLAALARLACVLGELVGVLNSVGVGSVKGLLVGLANGIDLLLELGEKGVGVVHLAPKVSAVATCTAAIAVLVLLAKRLLAVTAVTLLRLRVLLGRVRVTRGRVVTASS